MVQESEGRRDGGARRFARRLVTASPESLVTGEPLREGAGLPLVIRPAAAGVNLAEWARGNREFIETQLFRHGGLLFRDFAVRDAATFESFVRAASGDLLTYRERSSPRSQVGGNVYTSTDYPAARSIFLHNENSYQHVFPLKIFFCCVRAAESGGETPVADCRRVLRRIDPAVQERFAQKGGWMLVRNFRDDLGLPWRTVFQTDDKARVDDYCRQAGIETEWDGDALKTRQVRPAVATHPRTGEAVWFNHAAFFHVTTLEPDLRQALLAQDGEAGLPNNTFYGDGSDIEPRVVEHLREAYLREAVKFPWREGDVLMLDNMLAAHGREPFTGPRQIIVGMAEPYSRPG